ncbi:unnamed protein product [Rotaria sp. Silwood1]|nr:unnamed protein product [Rotaria sp. Silwood1]
MTAKLLRQIKSLWKIGDVAASTESVSNIEPRRLMVPNYLLIWVDEAIDETNDNCQHMLAQLRSVVNNVRLCTNTTQCIEVLNDADSKKVFVVSSDDLGQHLVPEIHQITQVDSIYIFSNNQVLHEKWTKDWSKIQGIFTSIQSICDLLKTSIREYDHHAIPMSFVPKLMIDTVIAPAVSDKQNLDQLEPSFMYSLLFKKVLLEIDEDDAKPLQDLVVYCRSQNIPEPQLELFQQEYYLKTPVWCIFRVEDIKQTVNNNRLWEVQLTLTDHKDPQLAALTDRIEGELHGSTGWQRLGDLMIRAGHFKQAEDLYSELFKSSSSDSDRAEVYHQLGYVNKLAGKYENAISFYEKSLEIKKNIFPEEHLSLADTYDGIGEEYSTALDYFEKCLTIFNHKLTEKNLKYAMTYSFMGDVYRLLEDYEMALSYHQKALNIQEIVPCSPLECATVYSNMGFFISN